TGTVDVSVTPGCGYNTVVGPSWAHVTSGGSGTGGGTISFSVDANSVTYAREATWSINGQPFHITQAALACSATLDTSGLGSPYGVGRGAGSVGIAMNGANCSWQATGSPWASVSPPSGTGSGSVLVTVGSNSGSIFPRAASIRIAGQDIALQQDGIVCSYGL